MIEHRGETRVHIAGIPLVGDVHIWQLEMRGNGSEPSRALFETLSEDERARAGRYRFPRHREQFVLVRGMLRRLIGEYLRITPSRVRLSVGDRGKPRLDTRDGSLAPLRFNVSHTDDVALLAFTWDREVGVDVEAERPLPEMLDLAERFFVAREAAAIAGMPLAERPRAFFTCWARKEAVLKATGDGLSGRLDRLEVGVVPRPAHLQPVSGHGLEHAWSLLDLPVGPRMAAALAVEGSPRRVVYGTIHPHAT